MRSVQRLIPCCLAAALGLPAFLEARDAGLETGEMFPEIPFTALEDGSVRHLSDFRGEKLVLHVFASW